MPGWASWLFAAPHTTVALSACTVRSSSAPPSAQGAYTSRSSRDEVLGAGDGLDLRERALQACATAAVSTSVTTTSAPSSTSSRDRCLPTLPTPAIADPAAVERRAAPQVGGRRPHALEHPERGEHGGVARAAVDLGAAGGEVGLARHDVHVGDVGAHVARGHVPPASDCTNRP